MPSAKNIIVPIVINTGCRLKSVSRLVVLKTDIITIMVQVARSVWKIVLFSAVAFGIYLKIWSNRSDRHVPYCRSFSVSLFSIAKSNILIWNYAHIKPKSWSSWLFMMVLIYVLLILNMQNHVYYKFSNKDQHFQDTLIFKPLSCSVMMETSLWRTPHHHHQSSPPEHPFHNTLQASPRLSCRYRHYFIIKNCIRKY